MQQYITIANIYGFGRGRALPPLGPSLQLGAQALGLGAQGLEVLVELVVRAHQLQHMVFHPLDLDHRALGALARRLLARLKEKERNRKKE